MTESHWLYYTLILGAVLFCSGLFLVLSRKNALLAMAGIELMLNAANVNLVAFSKYYPGAEGQVTTLFIMIVAAAEAAVGLALVLGVWRLKGSANVDEIV